MTWTVKWFTKWLFNEVPHEVNHFTVSVICHNRGAQWSITMIFSAWPGFSYRYETFLTPIKHFIKKTWNLFPFCICYSIITRLLHMKKRKLFSTILLNNLGYHFRWLWWPATTFVRTSGACRIPVASPWLVNDIKIWKEVKKMGVSITMMETIYHYDGNSVENGFLSQWLK